MKEPESAGARLIAAVASAARGGGLAAARIEASASRIVSRLQGDDYSTELVARGAAQPHEALFEPNVVLVRRRQARVSRIEEPVGTIAGISIVRPDQASSQTNAIEEVDMTALSPNSSVEVAWAEQLCLEVERELQGMGSVRIVSGSHSMDGEARVIFAPSDPASRFSPETNIRSGDEDSPSSSVHSPLPSLELRVSSPERCIPPTPIFSLSDNAPALLQAKIAFARLLEEPKVEINTPSVQPTLSRICHLWYTAVKGS